MIARLVPILFALSCPLWITACSQSAAPPSAAAENTTQPSAPVALLRGQLSRQSDGEAYLTPCGSQQRWRFRADPLFWQRWAQLGNPSALYAELEGHLALSNERGGDLELTLERVDHLGPESKGCQRDTDFTFHAVGQQPAWTLTLQGDSALFSSPAGSSSYRLTESHQLASGEQVLNLTALNGEAASLSYVPALCQQAELNQIWGYQVTFSQGDTHLEGCGERGRPMAAVLPAPNWYGLAPSMQAQIGLTLSPEHQASLIYYRDSGPQIDYQGAWQPTEQGITLLFNQRNGLAANESIPLHRQGKTLQASYRQLNGGKAYFDEPLSLQPGTPALPLPPQAQASAYGNHTTPTQAAFTPVVLQPAQQPDPAIQQALLDYFRINQSNPSGVQYRAIRYDLNGDGHPDAIVQMNWCDKTGCVWLLFQGSVDGYRFLSRLEGVQSPLLIAPTRHKSWHDLVVQSGFQQWASLIFDGISYPTALAAATPVETPASNSHSELRFDGSNWLTLP
jgi:putative lipoprotein